MAWLESDADLDSLKTDEKSKVSAKNLKGHKLFMLSIEKLIDFFWKFSNEQLSCLGRSLLEW